MNPEPEPKWRPLDEAFPDETTVRVLEPDEVPRAPRVDDGARLPQPKLSRAQQRLDDILTDVENELREARDLTARALEDFILIEPKPQHPNLPTLIGQQLEQVIELRSLRRR
jgi:hypothetical protein